MIEKGLLKESAAYAFKCCELNRRIQNERNERESIIQAYENRFFSQIIRAFKEKRYFDIIKIAAHRLLNNG